MKGIDTYDLLSGLRCNECIADQFRGELTCHHWWGMSYEDAIVESVDAQQVKQRLIAFEKRVAEAFEKKEIKGPVHLSGGNEHELIGIWREIHPDDWIVTFYRNHYHALLHGIPEEKLFKAICDGHSMTLQFPEHRFFSTAIVGAQLSIACGIAAAIKSQQCHRKVWCFLGDMAASIGAFAEAQRYALGLDLPITFIVEDNGLSCNTPTASCWGGLSTFGNGPKTKYYDYQRIYPHVGIDKWVQF